MNQIERRMFIIGTPRSGTTLLQSFLVSHSKIHSFPETHFFSSIAVNTARRFGLIGKKKLRRYNHLLSEVLQYDEKLIPFGAIPVSTNRVIQQFLTILDYLTLSENKTIWVEKTPMHLHSLEYIAKHAPESLFIHIIRDGVDVVTSLVEVTSKYPKDWGGNRSIESCVKRWNEDIAITLAYKNHSKHFILQYEKLIESPEAVLRTLCSFIGIDFENEMINERTKNASSIINPEEFWKTNNFKQVKRKEDSKITLSTEEQNYVRKHLKNYSEVKDMLKSQTTSGSIK